VINRDSSVLVWNDSASELWGLRDDETRSRNIFGLDIGLPIERLSQPIRDCLGGSQGQVVLLLDAINRRGRPVRCVVTITPLRARDEVVLGVILNMDTRPPQGDGNGGDPFPIKGKLGRTTNR
jgi:two-component system CheB/CheR fusion protein